MGYFIMLYRRIACRRVRDSMLHNIRATAAVFLRSTNTPQSFIKRLLFVIVILYHRLTPRVLVNDEYTAAVHTFVWILYKPIFIATIRDSYVFKKKKTKRDKSMMYTSIILQLITLPSVRPQSYARFV